MSLLAEYALTPDVFDTTSYISNEIGTTQLQYLKEVLLNEGLVRNLRNGSWFSQFESNSRPWHQRGRELLKKLAQQKRLRVCSSTLPNDPTNDYEWCQEAVESHKKLPLTGIVSTKAIVEQLPHEALITSMDRLAGTQWWTERSSSIRLGRKKESYAENLRLVLQCANSIMFIDPHLDPSLQHYKDFIYLLKIMVGRNPSPLIEIHRVCYFGSRSNRDIIPEAEWRSRFSNAWSDLLCSTGLTLKVFIWDDFHDRYVISDLIGISVPNGFDTTTDPDDITTWTRLGRKDRDDIQREFDPAANRHKLRYTFNVEAQKSS